MSDEGVVLIKFEDIYNEQAKHVFRYIYSLCGNYHLAEDLTQETFLRAYKHRNDYDESKKVLTWLCTIAKNLYLDHLKSRKNGEIPDEEIISEVSHNLDERILERDVLKLIHRLTDPYKEVFMLRYSMGLSYHDIADIFGQKESWARLVFYKARVRLMEMLEGEKT